MSCRFLPWDSALFGVRIARLDDVELTIESATAALEYCAAESIDCLYYLARANDQASIAVAEKFGFAQKDVRLTLERSLEDWGSPSDARVRLLRDGDLPAIEAIAAVAHEGTRFYVDENFARDKVSELYRAWIRKACSDESGAVFVFAPVEEAPPLGYVSCDAQGAIGLIAVAASARRSSAGQSLVSAALDWMTARGLASASVVTQGRNVAAQRMYQRAGFVTRSLELWYHKWLDRPRRSINAR